MAREISIPVDPTVEKRLFIGSSSMDDRFPLVLRVCPTRLKRLREVTEGPVYLAIEYAIEELLQRIEALPARQTLTVPGDALKPSAEDKRLMAKLRKTAEAKKEKAAAVKAPTVGKRTREIA